MLEFIMALAVMAMVAAAISSMLSSVAMGERLRRDNRAFVVRTHAVKTRLAAYISRCRSVLAANETDLALWLNDARASGTVHATEIRWLIFNDIDGTIDVYFVDLPSEWTDVQAALEDVEYLAGDDFFAILSEHMAKDQVSKLTLVDGLDTVLITIDGVNALDARNITYDLHFRTQGDPLTQTVRISMLGHLPPTS